MSAPPAKQFLSADQLLADAFRLGVQVLDSGFRPSFIVGIWRGGTPVGIAVQELLEYRGVTTDHIAIRTSLYRGIGDRHAETRVHGLQYVIDNVDAEDGLLLVDDVYDTGLSIDAVIRHLERGARRNTPRDIRVATTYYKPDNNRTERVPDYYVHETDRWLVFPHELQDLTPAEILQHKPALAPFARRWHGGTD